MENLLPTFIAKKLPTPKPSRTDLIKRKQQEKKNKEREMVRHCLKHFRQMNYQEAFESLQKCTNVQLEVPLMGKLHDMLVNCGDYDEAEHFIENSINDGLFIQYIKQQEYEPKWCPIHPEDIELLPWMRGGHQMCMDPSSETIYLFGGWDGTQDLSDLWSYHVPTLKWTLISNDTKCQGGPSARSCHKMCLDPQRRQIFVLGKFLDLLLRFGNHLKSDFHVYDIEKNKWKLLMEDTGSKGGPQLIYDHQMCMDTEKKTIYVFGGRVNMPIVGMTDTRLRIAGSTEEMFSGLFSYHIPSNKWKKLCEDCGCPNSSGVQTIRSRTSHSMLFHTGSRKLFIMAGERGKGELKDFFTYNVDTHKVCVIKTSKKDANNILDGNYTLRATIDPERNEIYVHSALSKAKEVREKHVQNSFWVYYILRNEWSCIYRNEHNSEEYWNKMQNVEPYPRYGHQLVYNETNKVHYMFGGNAGQASHPELRLDDFWQLQCLQPTSAQLLQRCKLLIRKHRFQEIALKNRIEALDYLHTSLSDFLDPDDPKGTKELQTLPWALFRNHEEWVEPTMKDSESEDGDKVARYQIRSKLFDLLSWYFPENMTQPKTNLIDIVSW